MSVPKTDMVIFHIGGTQGIAPGPSYMIIKNIQHGDVITLLSSTYYAKLSIQKGRFVTLTYMV